MPTVDVEQNIRKLRETIEQMTQEVFRLQGTLRLFVDFKKSGLKVVELPHEPREEAEEEPQAEEPQAEEPQAEEPVEEVAESSTQE
jgi:hypothetical protein